MLGRAQHDLHKKSIGTRYSELVFLHPVCSAAHVVHFGASRVQNVNALFFMLGWAQCGFHRKRTGTCYPELVLLHSVESAGHVVDSGPSGSQNIYALLFILVRG
jgi:hypothetical protein